MKFIQLVGKHSDYYFTVDDDIFNEMMKFAWSGHPASNTMYVCRGFRDQNRRFRRVYVHRYCAYLYGILFHWDFEIDSREIDHIDHDGLNETRENLRAGTKQENLMNMRANRGGISQYKGVAAVLDSKIHPWKALITENGKQLYLGVFPNDTEAALAYDKKARELGWPESGLNFPRGV